MANTTSNQVSKKESNSSWALGFSAFAGMLMILVGTFDFLEGFAAIVNNEFYVVGRSYVYSLDVTTWGWIHLFLGVFIGLAGLAVLAGQTWGRVVGVIMAIISAVANFFVIPYYPFWAILIIALDIAIIWALTAYKLDDEPTTPYTPY